MTGKNFGRFTRENSWEDRRVTHQSSKEEYESDRKTRRNGNRSIVQSFISPDSSAISKMRREIEIQDTNFDNI